MYSYFRNQRQIVKRLLWVGHGWMGYTVALLIMLFVVFIMVMALTEIPPPA
jgi:putative membrane protein